MAVCLKQIVPNCWCEKLIFHQMFLCSCDRQTKVVPQIACGKSTPIWDSCHISDYNPCQIDEWNLSKHKHGISHNRLGGLHFHILDSNTHATLIPASDTSDTHIPDSDTPDTHILDCDTSDTHIPDSDTPDTHILDHDTSDTHIPNSDIWHPHTWQWHTRHIHDSDTHDTNIHDSDTLDTHILDSGTQHSHTWQWHTTPTYLTVAHVTPSYVAVTHIAPTYSDTHDHDAHIHGSNTWHPHIW